VNKIHLFFIHNWRTLLIAQLVERLSPRLDKGVHTTYFICARGFAPMISQLGLGPVFDIDPIFNTPYSYLNAPSPITLRYLLSAGESISRFLGMHNSVLFVPHLADPWMRFLTSLPQIIDVNFIEEGNKISANQIDSVHSQQASDVLSQTSVDDSLTCMFCQELTNPNLVKSSTLFCTQDNNHVIFRKHVFSDSEIKSCVKTLLASHPLLSNSVQIGARLSAIGTPLLLGAKTYLQQHIFIEMILEAFRSPYPNFSSLAYKPHPSCHLHYSRHYRDKLLNLSVILCPSKYPIDLAIFAGVVPALIGDTSSVMITAKRLGVEVCFIGTLEQTPNIKCNGLRNVYQQARLGY